MTKTLRWMLVSVLATGAAFGSAGIARATISNSCTGAESCQNVQQGSNRSTGNQQGSSKSGSAVGGQVVGVVSSGATSVDARNTSENVDVSSGNAKGTNTADSLTGLNSSDTTGVGALGADITGVGSADNLQEGGNTSTLNQTATATTGDAVGGQVIGAVTSAGGSASIVAANTSKNSDISTGNSSAANSVDAFTGVNDSDALTVADVTNVCTTGEGCDNVQQGSNRLTGSQNATAATGDGVGGQVLGVVSAGRTSLDATNRTEDSSVNTGNSNASNSGDEFAGLNTVSGGTTIADVTGVGSAGNLQEGDNRRLLSQSASATSGDAVAGQVSGVVTSAGGSASVVVDNTSTGIDATSGQSTFSNDDNGFVGHNFGGGPLTI